MKKLIYLILLMIPFCVKAQSPVIISQPYKFQKWVLVKDSLLTDQVIPDGDSTHKVPSTAWVLRNAGTSGGSVATLTLGFGLTGTSFNGGSPVTTKVDTATLKGVFFPLFLNGSKNVNIGQNLLQFNSSANGADSLSFFMRHDFMGLESTNISGQESSFSYQPDSFESFHADAVGNQVHVAGSDAELDMYVNNPSNKSNGFEIGLDHIRISSGIEKIGMVADSDWTANIVNTQNAYTTTAAVTKLIDSLASAGTVLSVLGTINRITSSGGANPVIDISSSYVGQSSITTVGTLVAGSIPYSLLSGTVPTWNQNTTGSAAKLTTARNIAGNASFDGSANLNFANKFVVQGTSDPGLTGAQFLGALSTGIVKNTTTTGVLSIAAAGADYQAPITLTTTGTSGASTFIGNTLNIPIYTTYTAANGLTLSGTTFNLGGTLSTSESIILGGNIFSIHSLSSGITSDASFGASFGHLQLTDASNNTALIAVGLDVGSHAFAKLGIDVALNTTSITKTAGTAGLIITDTQDLKGISYAADYSTNFTARSLIDKGYGDSHYGTGSGSVTTVSVVTANGVSGSVATATTTPAITLSLGNITPTSINSIHIPANVFQTPLGTAGTDSVVVKIGSTKKLGAISPTYYAKIASPTFTGTVTAPTVLTTMLPLSTYQTRLGNSAGSDSIVVKFGSSGRLAAISGDSFALSASPTFTGTVGLPTVSMSGDILPTATNTYSLGTSGNVLFGVWTDNANITSLTVSTQSSFGGIMYLNGSTSGQIQLTTQAVAGNYSWNWPTTHGTTGQVLTSDGGAGGMTWTTLTNYAFASPTATTQSALTNNTTVATTAYADAAVAATATYFASGLFGGSGTSGSPYTLGTGIVGIANLSATGTPSSSTFLRGDNTWAAASGSGVTTVGTFSGSSQTNGASISTTTMTFGPADATNPGMVTIGAQTFGSGTKTWGGTQIAPIFKGASATFDIVLQDGSGNQAFRSTNANGWADAVAAQFFQVGASTGKAFFTASVGTVFGRLGFSSSATQFTTGSYITTPAPTGIFDVNNGTNSLFNIASTGLTDITSLKIQPLTLSAINSTATATSAQVATGCITSTSGAATSITMPTASAMATTLSATAGLRFFFTVDNSAGANTVTMVVNTGVTTGSVLTGGTTLTVASGTVAVFELYFTSATACKLIRIA